MRVRAGSVRKEDRRTLWVRVRLGTVCKGGVRARTVCKEGRGTLWVQVRALRVRKCTKKAKIVYKRAHRGLVRLRTVRKGRVRPVYNSKLTSQLGTSLRQNPSSGASSDLALNSSRVGL